MTLQMGKNQLMEVHVVCKYLLNKNKQKTLKVDKTEYIKIFYGDKSLVIKTVALFQWGV